MGFYGVVLFIYLSLYVYFPQSVRSFFWLLFGLKQTALSPVD